MNTLPKSGQPKDKHILPQTYVITPNIVCVKYVVLDEGHISTKHIIDFIYISVVIKSK